jgi:ATP-dependent protease ClpP protease subunit
MDPEGAKKYGIIDEILTSGKLAVAAGGDSAKE